MKRHTPEEIIKKLSEAEGVIAAGKRVDASVRAIGVSLAACLRWKTRFGFIKKDLNA